MIFQNHYSFPMEKNSDWFYQKQISSEMQLIVLSGGPYTGVFCFTYALNKLCKPIECKKNQAVSVRCKQLKRTDCFKSDNSSNVVCATVLLK